MSGTNRTVSFSEYQAVQIDTVELTSLVVMNLIKHYEDEIRSGSSDPAQGYLVGLVATGDRRLEVTNCFPKAKPASSSGQMNDKEEEAKKNEEYDYQQDMLRKYRHINIDSLLVGFYQAAPFGACFNQAFTETMYEYQFSQSDSVALVYDPMKTAEGMLAISAYRLSPDAMKLCYFDYSPESMKRAGLSYENMFEKLPVTIRNSRLTNIALMEMSLMRSKSSSAAKPRALQLGVDADMERGMRQMMSRVDGLNREVQQYNRYLNQKQRADHIRETMIQKRQMENEARREKGQEPIPLTDEEIAKAVKVMQAPVMLEGLLSASDINAHADHAYMIASQNLGKLFMAESLMDERRDRTMSHSAM